MQTRHRRHESCHSEVRGTKEFLDGITREFKAHVKATQLFNALARLGREDAEKSRSRR